MRYTSESTRAPRRGCPAGRAAALCLLAMLCVSATACKGAGRKQVGEATLAMLAMGTEDIPEAARDAPVVVVMPDRAPTIPNAPVVKLAVDVHASWGLVKSILAEMKARGQKPVMLIAEDRELRAFNIEEDPIDGPIIEIMTNTTGRLCVHHPDARDAKCHESTDEKYIDPAATRELVREAMKGYKRHNFLIELADAQLWSNVVSAVGGARSCCGDTRINLAFKE